MQNWHNTNTNSQSVFHAQVTSSAKVYENISEFQHANAQSIAFQETFDLIEQTEELIEPYRAKTSEVPDKKILKEVLHRNHATFSSCAKMHLNLKPTQHASSQLQSAVILLKHVFTMNLFSKR